MGWQARGGPDDNRWLAGGGSCRGQFLFRLSGVLFFKQRREMNKNFAFLNSETMKERFSPPHVRKLKKKN